MKKIMFNDNFGLTDAVLKGEKTMTRRIVPEGTPLGNWDETVKKSRYQIGEIVAIAQSYHSLNKNGYVAPEWLDHYCESSAGYDNKMFVRADLMPHQIRITDIRIEPLQKITNEDCLREGIYRDLRTDGMEMIYYPCRECTWEEYQTPQSAFASLIDKVSGKGTWDSNPWVWVYTFELVK